MRRLIPTLSAIVFIDTTLFAAIVPLLPTYVDEHDLSKLGAGVLVAAYGAGAVVAGIPAGLAVDRVGVRGVTIVGLLTLSVATIGFALAESPEALVATRFAQGVASAVTWSGALAWLVAQTDRERRGQVLGTAFAIAVLGFIVGPAIGALAEHTSIVGTFVTVAAIVLALAALTYFHPAPPREPMLSGTNLARGITNRGLLAAVWLTLVPGLYFGAVDVLVPLSLDRDGWGSVAIAATFIGAGMAEVVLAARMGRFSDQRGRLVPVRVGLWLLGGLAVVMALAAHPLMLALLVVAAAIAATAVTTPSVALVADRADEIGLPHGLSFGLMNSAWATGIMLGPAAAGALADSTSDAAPYLVAGAVSIATVVLVVGVRGSDALAAQR